ncbi:hypothetical protein [Segatella salivae]|uniref:hypothetical protein n=1 Tax=Segatella salivae TaxID=228604 RepID=UPI0009D66E0B
MQKTADRSNRHTREIISVTYICISLPIPNMGNDLVTELLHKSTYFCSFQSAHFYTVNSISHSLSDSFRIIR